MVTMARNTPGPTSAHPINSSGPTASNAALPYAPVTMGSATFNASVTRLAKINRCLAGRSRAVQGQMSCTEKQCEDGQVY